MIHSIKIHSGNYINIDDNLKLYYNSENMFDIKMFDIQVHIYYYILLRSIH